MRRTTLAAIGAALGITLATVVAGPAGAGTPTPTPRACTGTAVSTTDLASGCTVTSGRLVLPDGRVFTVPAPGTSVAALPVVAAADGAPDEDVVVSNTGRSGVAVHVGESWLGSPAAVTAERAAAARRTLGAGGGVRPRAAAGSTTSATVAASCSSRSYVLSGHHWNAAVSWRYNASGEKTAGVSAVRSAASAWDGALSSCGTKVTSTARNTYLGTTTLQPAVTAAGGCGAMDRTNTVGWGSLPSGVLGLTCVWFGSDGVAQETDQRYATGFTWNSAATCSGSRFDLRGVATHEWGHAYGLGHTAQSSGLVMKPSSTTCETAQRTLGLGDVLGIDALY